MGPQLRREWLKHVDTLRGGDLLSSFSAVSVRCLPRHARQKRQNVGKEREWDQNHQKRTAQTPLQVRSAPRETRSRPKPRSGAGPGQVRSGKVEPNKRPQELVQGTETALTWRAVN